jgi:hypothetical protein
MWKIMAWQRISLEVTLKGQMMQWMRLIMVWNDCEGDGCVRRMTVKGIGMLGVNVRKLKALTMQMETVTLIGNGK